MPLKKEQDALDPGRP